MTFDPVSGITQTVTERFAEQPELVGQVEPTAELAWATFTELRDKGLQPTRAEVVARVESESPVDRVVINAVADALFNT